MNPSSVVLGSTNPEKKRRWERLLTCRPDIIQVEPSLGRGDIEGYVHGIMKESSYRGETGGDFPGEEYASMSALLKAVLALDCYLEDTDGKGIIPVVAFDTAVSVESGDTVRMVHKGRNLGFVASRIAEQSRLENQTFKVVTAGGVLMPSQDWKDVGLPEYLGYCLSYEIEIPFKEVLAERDLPIDWQGIKVEEHKLFKEGYLPVFDNGLSYQALKSILYYFDQDPGLTEEDCVTEQGGVIQKDGGIYWVKVVNPDLIRASINTQGGVVPSNPFFCRLLTTEVPKMGRVRILGPEVHEEERPLNPEEAIVCARSQIRLASPINRQFLKDYPSGFRYKSDLTQVSQPFSIFVGIAVRRAFRRENGISTNIELAEQEVFQLLSGAMPKRLLPEAGLLAQGLIGEAVLQSILTSRSRLRLTDSVK